MDGGRESIGENSIVFSTRGSLPYFNLLAQNFDGNPKMKIKNRKNQFRNPKIRVWGKKTHFRPFSTVPGPAWGQGGAANHTKIPSVAPHDLPGGQDPPPAAQMTFWGVLQALFGAVAPYMG